MAFSRLRILFGGTALVAVTGILSARVFLPELFGQSFAEIFFLSALIVVSPLTLIPMGIDSADLGGAVVMIAGGVVILLAFPICPLLKPKWFGKVGVVGLLLWIIFQAFYAVLIVRNF